MSQFHLQVQGVDKSFGQKKVLHQINLDLQGSTLFALLGPNGAGKTTLIKTLLHLIRADKGTILLNGIPPHDERSRQNLAYLPEKFSFYPYYTVQNTLKFFAHIYHHPPTKQAALMDLAHKKMDLGPLLSQKLQSLSKGQLQRVGLAKLLISDAQFLILDEPFSGLDPLGIKELKDLLRELRNQGKTLFLNSHILSEVEQMADEVAILNHGKILFRGKLSEVQKKSSLENFFYQTIKDSEKLS
jgi:ABC-2 type transport system ATP-binding protein